MKNWVVAQTTTAPGYASDLGRDAGKAPGERSPESGLEGGREGLWVQCMGKRCRSGVSLVRCSCSPAWGEGRMVEKEEAEEGAGA